MYLLMNFHCKGKKCDIFPSNIAWSMFLVSFIFTAKMLNVNMLQLVEKILSTFYILLNEIKIYTRRGLVYYLLKDFCYTWAFFCGIYKSILHQVCLTWSLLVAMLPMRPVQFGLESVQTDHDLHCSLKSQSSYNFLFCNIIFPTWLWKIYMYVPSIFLALSNQENIHLTQ